MSKKYVIEEALLSCQYGNSTCKLKPWADRHIYIGDKLIASECDIGNLCSNGTFGSCRSPFVASVKREYRDNMKSQQQLVLCNDIPCEMSVRLQWQNAKDDVFLGGYKALLDDGWTICETGLGIVSLVDSGQAQEVLIQEMQERLQQLNSIIDDYISKNGISPKQKSAIMDSVLLWNGYLGQDICWDYKSNETNREFCSYLEKTNPHLFNYFERGLYIEDGENGPIDLSYMMGVNKALNGTKDEWECVSQTIAEDRGMYNGYLEACRKERGKNSYECLNSFLNSYSDPDYDSYERYKSYASYPPQDWRDRYCRDQGYDPNELSVTEQNIGVLHNMITGRIQDQMSFNPEGDPKLGDIVQEQSSNANKVADLFLGALREDLKKGE